jgi:hypothetical protein
MKTTNVEIMDVDVNINISKQGSKIAQKQRKLATYMS